MSLNDLLPLLFVAAFVVNAIVRGRQAQRRRQVTRERRERQGRTGGAGPSGPEAQGAPAGRTDRNTGAGREAAGPGAGPAEARAPQGGGEADSDSPADDLRRRIEEARRRVREAMGEAEEAPSRPAERPVVARAGGAPAPAPSAGGTATPSAGPATGGMTAGTMFSGPRTTPGAPGAPVPSFLGREGEPPAPEVARRRTRRAAQDAPTVTRRAGPPGSARLRAAKGLGSDRDDIVRGFVWSVVFEDPVAIRMRRRTVSPRRSP